MTPDGLNTQTHAQSDALLFQLNGEPRQAPPGASLASLITELGLTGKRIAIECNGSIVPRSQYTQQLIAAGDQIEIVGAVGGG